jgi:hypothetical protein
MSTTLADLYKVNRHFQRAKRLDTDLALDGLEGYQLNQTAWHVLDSLSEDIAHSRQRAFTWTGPYGSGKSSLALLLAALLSGKGSDLQEAACHILGAERTARFYDRMAVSDQGWLVVRVVGRRESPISALSDALAEACDARWGSANPLMSGNDAPPPNLRQLTSNLEAAARKAASENDGLLILVDEMGKFLEFAAVHDGDLYPFQEIAELLSRLDTPCAFLGILHQSFDEYARRGSREARAEWSKIQGRFTDTPFSIAIEEVVALIGSAISSGGTRPVKFQKHIKRVEALAQQVGQSITSGRFSKLASLPSALATCAPLHPVAALLLGPISRRRFGQNERSVFSFLSSREPHSFGDFLKHESRDSRRLYTAADLWDYLQLNHEPTILASPDGSRWAEAAEAVLRVSRRPEATEQHVSALKTVAVLDLFGTPYGLGASDALVSLALEQPGDRAANHRPILQELKAWSAIIERRHVGGWGIFAGSDIDIEAETERARSAIQGDLDQVLARMPDLPPVVAKRHYARTGTLRVFERQVIRAGHLSTRAPNASGVTGRFCLAIGGPMDLNLSDRGLLLNQAGDQTTLLVGIPESHSVVEKAVTVAALERVQATVPQLSGDPAARRELAARITQAQHELSEELGVAFANADWEWPARGKHYPSTTGISEIASAVCDEVFHLCPRIVNELLNRERPSSSAVAARRRLAYAMVESATSKRLGIEAEPAELGLYLSILGVSGIHGLVGDGGGWEFHAPKDASFRPMWDEATKLLQQASSPVAVHQLYEFWRQPPYGIRSGVLPILALALILANQSSIALYVEGNFTTRLDDVVVDRLLQAPEQIGLRWVNASEVGTDMLAAISQFVQEMGLGNRGMTALEVTKPLVQFAFRLPGWVRRTRQLRQPTLQVRDLLLETRDPYALLLCDLPRVCGKDDISEDDGPEIDIDKLAAAIEELRGKQDELLGRFRDILSRALLADLNSPAGLRGIAQRAKLVANAPESIDLRTKRFAQVLAEAERNPNWLEAVCGLAAGRPLKDWADPDIGRTALELTGLTEQFGQVEAEITVATSDNDHLQRASDELLATLTKQKLDPNQQRAALLYALKKLGNTHRTEKAA